MKLYVNLKVIEVYSNTFRFILRIVLLNIVFLLCTALLHAQVPAWHFDHTIKVTDLLNPWRGGLNTPQFSYGHLLKGRSHLLAYDRTNHKALVFEVLLQSGANNLYRPDPDIEQLLPDLSDWALMADYNQDGLADIFTWGNPGVIVYKNVSTTFMAFEKVDMGLTYTQSNQSFPLFINPKDVPAIKDMDADGDLDILSFNYPDGDRVLFYQNMSFEKTGKTDWLIYEKASGHWGSFSEISCVEYDFSPNPNRALNQTERVAHIGGGAILPIDLNGDQQLDVIIGKEGCRHVNVLLNQEVKLQKYWFSHLDTLFPKPAQAVIDIFPAGYSLPLDKNGSDVIILSPNVEVNAGYKSDFEHSVWLLTNQSKGGSTNFQNADSSFLQSDMIDVGEQSVPSFVDLDQDGDQDLVIGNKGSFSDKYHAGRLTLYENAGTTDAPVFQLKDSDWLLLSVKGWFNLRPQFADIDGDGIVDFIITNTFNYQIGDSDVKWAKGSLQNGSLQFGSDFIPLAVSINISDAPVFFDMDQDGDQDILMGKANGALEYWENNGYPDVNFVRISSKVMGLGQNANFNFLRVLPYTDDDKHIHLVAFSNGISMAYLGEWQPEAATSVCDSHLVYLETYKRFVVPDLGLFISPASINTNEGTDIVLGAEPGGLLYLTSQKRGGIVSERPLNVWPNPAKGTVNVQSNKDGAIFCYDLSGKVLFHTIISANFTKVMALHSLAKGCYFIKFVSDTETHVEKLLVD